LTLVGATFSERFPASALTDAFAAASNDWRHALSERARRLSFVLVGRECFAPRWFGVALPGRGLLLSPAVVPAFCRCSERLLSLAVANALDHRLQIVTG
jgi:hypothetical protein